MPLFQNRCAEKSKWEALQRRIQTMSGIVEVKILRDNLLQLCLTSLVDSAHRSTPAVILISYVSDSGAYGMKGQVIFPEV